MSCCCVSIPPSLLHSTAPTAPVVVQTYEGKYLDNMSISYSNLCQNYMGNKTAASDGEYKEERLYTATSTVSIADANEIAKQKFIADPDRIANGFIERAKLFAEQNNVCLQVTEYVGYYGNDRATVTVLRNNCPSGYEPVPLQFTYSKRATGHSTISQEDADRKAREHYESAEYQALLRTQEQDYANQYGQCRLIPVVQPTVYTGVYSGQLSGQFTRNNCPAVTTPATVTYTKPISATATSTVSQADADAKAKVEAERIGQATFAAEGQAYANSVGACTPITVTSMRLEIAYRQGGSGPFAPAYTNRTGTITADLPVAAVVTSLANHNVGSHFARLDITPAPNQLPPSFTFRVRNTENAGTFYMHHVGTIYTAYIETSDGRSHTVRMTAPNSTTFSGVPEITLVFDGANYIGTVR